jgi:hypothetical protein
MNGDDDEKVPGYGCALMVVTAFVTAICLWGIWNAWT